MPDTEKRAGRGQPGAYAPPRLAERTSDSPLRMPTVGQALRGFAVAIRLRCPHCAKGFVLTRTGAVRERCTGCGLRFTRTDDNYFGGAVFFGLFCGELAVALTLLTVILLTWPQVPWNGILYGTTAGCLLALPVSLPFAKVVWLSVDTLVRPVRPEELMGE
jgi:uncharacterized protein (DUF983 family)